MDKKDAGMSAWSGAVGLFADDSLAWAGRAVTYSAPASSVGAAGPGGGTVDCEGHLFLPGGFGAAGEEGQPGGVPGVLLLHEYTGLGGYLFRSAAQLVRAGYAVLCADLYGTALRPTDFEQARACLRPLRDDRALLHLRARAGLDALASVPGVDAARLLAMGFSLGGGATLELVRAGAPLRGAASMYGYLSSSQTVVPGAAHCPVLVHLAGRDHVIPLRDVEPFVSEMSAASVDCRVVLHAGAAHGFCNAAYGTEYDAEASWHCPCTEARAWDDVLRFFTECLKKN
ncbi:dienelactone hydrolase family protein [Desulfovibrio oxamicus]|uniref:Dienelactone hydrolase family protein n=1 Tax=Nitratidesulfovibrio oxamicus TaxID=32016 RepID=A0ABS0J5W2_9BACT|nr:dienelactone hydrolase family protein [Nitratidesulfovibrio oxamicus]MBG3877811.1 dienelactone hydrolase family protein [Nitratidesulfovibrio oxamicus]